MSKCFETEQFWHIVDEALSVARTPPSELEPRGGGL